MADLFHLMCTQNWPTQNPYRQKFTWSTYASTNQKAYRERAGVLNDYGLEASQFSKPGRGVRKWPTRTLKNKVTKSFRTDKVLGWP